MKLNSLDDNESNNKRSTFNESIHQCQSYMPKTSNASSLTSHDDIISRNNDFSFDHHIFNDCGDNMNNDLVSIQRELHEKHMHRESLLDEYCETIFDDSKTSHYSENTITQIKRIGFARGAAPTNGNIDSFSTSKNKSSYQIKDYSKSNGHASVGCAIPRRVNGGKSTKLDENEKTRLLAVLKNIDGNESIDK